MREWQSDSYNDGDKNEYKGRRCGEAGMYNKCKSQELRATYSRAGNATANYSMFVFFVLLKCFDIKRGKTKEDIRIW